jgi:hypothetical protein
MSAVLTTTSPANNVTLTPKAALETAILQTVAYVDEFDYPLTADEVHRYLIALPATLEQVETILGNGRLIPHQLSHQDNYFMLPGRENIAAVRQQRQAIARQMWPQALKYGRLIAHLPFVRMVAVTGSLAVNNAIEGADIDYLVVTENGRLWLSRAFVICIVRLAARLGISLCPNYFLSQRALRIEDQNLYTAHELVQMIPLCGLNVYNYLQKVNGWTGHYLPNAGWSGSGQSDTPSAYHPRRLAEWTLNATFGMRLEQWEMQRKIRKLNRRQTAEANFSPDWCKGHFDDHARRILDNFENRTKSFTNQ